MDGLMDKLLNILLYPARFFEKLTDSRPILYAGIILIGIVDVFLPDAGGMFKHFFTGKEPASLYFNLAAAVLLIVVLGLIDVIFISVPLFDFFKFLKSREEASMSTSEESAGYLKHIASPVKIMKIYIMSHFIIIPVTTIVYFVFMKDAAASNSAMVQNLALTWFMLILIWAAAVITRVINTLFRFNPIFRRLTFIVVFTWNFLFGIVFEMEIINWLFKIFR